MIDESLLKSNFIGRDGFRWWIGQIPPTESQDAQINCDGWGNRSKVRIMGYHPHNTTELSNKDLPWAQVLLSTTDGTGAANYGTNHKLKQGDTVFGFFLDGDNAQIPVIIGCFGRTDQVASTEYAGPFIPFTGYTKRITNDGSRIKINEESEQTIKAQKSPYHLPPKIANSFNQISYFSGIGDTIQLGTAKPGSKMEKIATELENAIKFLQDLKSFPNLAQEWIDTKVEELCEEISKKIQGIATEIVSGVVNSTYEELQPVLKQGAEQVYNTVNSATFAATQSVSTAHLAAVKAQKETIEPVKELQKLIPCLISSIIESLGSLISDMVCALLKNVANFVSCVINQFLSGLLNGIIDLITTGMSGVLGVLSLLLSFSDFNLEDSVRKLSKGLLGIPSSLNCGEKPADPGVEKWKIGSGPEKSSPFNINNILSLANNARVLIDGESENPLSPLESIVGPLDFLSPNISVPNFNSALSKCFGGTPTACNPPSINIFGGGGSGASAIPIFGSIIGDGDNKTGSIIGAIITSSGSGYTYPPFITIKDNCGKGYGAVAQSVIEKGKVKAIVINSDGEGYPVGNKPKKPRTKRPRPVYTIVPSSTLVNEGDSVVFTVSTTNFGSGSLYWTIENTTGVDANDFITDFIGSRVNGTVEIINDVGSFSISIRPDEITEGNEQFLVRLRTESINGTIVTSSPRILITDTSQENQPTIPPTEPPAPIYTIVPSSTLVNEGDSVVFTVSTTNFGSGSLYWTIENTAGINANDFNTNVNGTVEIINDVGSFSVSIRPDEVTEGNEQFLVRLRTESINGTIVTSSPRILITDTSQENQPTIPPTEPADEEQTPQPEEPVDGEQTPQPEEPVDGEQTPQPEEPVDGEQTPQPEEPVDGEQTPQPEEPTISEVLILDPGYNYQPEDIVTDNFENEYDVVINNGSIISITPINITEITDLPILEVISKTGSGAKLKPVFGFRSTFQGEVKQVIDCVV